MNVSAEYEGLEGWTGLHQRLQDLQENYCATLNMLEDFDEDKRRLQQIQHATINLLEDFDQEKQRLQQTQHATINLLEDFDQEKQRLQQTHYAAMNLLEDFDQERQRSQLVHTATLNLLEDFDDERQKLAQTQGALINILEDIEVERANAQQSMSQLQTVNRELEGFSYSVSHDLRAPLRAISGFAQALVEDYGPQLDEHARRYLGLIQSNAHRMGRLIDDLLTFSRLGRQEMMEGSVDMSGLAQGVFSELTAHISDRRPEFVVQPVPPAQGDKAMLRQVLVNLLSNAMKFTRTRPRPIIEFGYAPEGAPDAYYVKDNGVGFDMRYVGKLFGVFQRLHDASEFEGTGVGLALVQRIIARHGGRVWAEGQVDGGATFYFTLPPGASR